MSKAIQNILTMIESGETSVAAVRMALTSYNRLKTLGVVFYPAPVHMSADDFTRIQKVADKYKLSVDSLRDFFTTHPWNDKPIQMIKDLRETFCTGLYDSKCIMEHLWKGIPVINEEMPAVVKTAAYRKGLPEKTVHQFYVKHNKDCYPETKIPRIKDAREMFGYGLADAKEFVEMLWN